MNRRSLEYWGGLLLVGLVGGALGATGVCVFVLKGNGLQNVISFLTLVVLAITLWFVYKYVVAAQKNAEAAQTSAVAALAQVEVARQVAVGAAPFVSDPILTVEQFARQELADQATRDRIDKWVQNGDVEDSWLMIEITNEGVGAAINLKVHANWPPHVGKGKKADEQGWMPSIGRHEEWNKDSLFFGKAPWVPPEKRKPWENGLQRHAWRIWRLKPGDQALLYFTEPDREKKHTLDLAWFDVFYRQEPVLPIKMVWEDDHWSTEWGEAAEFWQARVKQMIQEMAKIMEENGK